MSDPNVDPRLPGVFRDLSEKDVAEGVDAQLATSALGLRPVPLKQVADSHFRTTEEFWQAVLSEGVRTLRSVVLHDVLLSEWFPRSPGLYHTEQAAEARWSARGHVMPLSERQRAIYESSSPPDPVVYDLYAKMEMLRGGVAASDLAGG